MAEAAIDEKEGVSAKKLVVFAEDEEVVDGPAFEKGSVIGVDLPG